MHTDFNNRNEVSPNPSRYLPSSGEKCTDSWGPPDSIPQRGKNSFLQLRSEHRKADSRCYFAILSHAATPTQRKRDVGRWKTLVTRLAATAMSISINCRLISHRKKVNRISWYHASKTYRLREKIRNIICTVVNTHLRQRTFYLF